jgi:hypothetical protein
VGFEAHQEADQVHGHLARLAPKQLLARSGDHGIQGKFPERCSSCSGKKISPEFERRQIFMTYFPQIAGLFSQQKM